MDVIICLICHFYEASKTQKRNVIYIKGDPLKRSINNQLSTHLSFVMILHNIICSSLFTWRNIFGAIHPSLATFETYLANIWGNWCLLLLTEMSVIKAFLTFKWSWIVGVDEQFAGTFLIFLNLGYILISQTAR